jgi:NAD(P)-dependent dehydrogenase (short-subunit alcohol dehydrogenase family)
MNIVITGGSSGLGAALMRHLESDNQLFDWSYNHGVDVRDRASIKAAIDKFPELDRVDVLINCAGINLLQFIPAIKDDEWDDVMDTNARAMMVTTQELLPLLKNGTVVNIISNASHMPMTSSLVYNASKGAAAIMTKQMARELFKTHGITVFGISPNKLSGTHMSQLIDAKVCELRGWTPEQARDYQLAALPAGEETDPDTLAEFIAFLLSSKQRHKFLNGCIIPYGGPVQ